VPCKRKRHSAYRKTEAAKAVRLRATKRYLASRKGKAAAKRYRIRNRKKRYVSVLVWRAIQKGLLKREPCVICNNPQSEAHHFHYGKPLKVIFFCKEHHRM
jgi:hypothetical protein